MKNVTAIYFSPTGGTKSYVRAVARGIADDFREIDLTNRETRAKEHLFSPDEIAVIGVPVYYGRIPQLPDELLRGLTASHTPAVFVVVYGNREFDDALLELSDLCEKQGFYGAAACAFVAQHTFSRKSRQDDRMKRTSRSRKHLAGRYGNLWKQRMQSRFLCPETGRTGRLLWRRSRRRETKAAPAAEHACGYARQGRSRRRLRGRRMRRNVSAVLCAYAPALRERAG